jgi:hypothetical protein
MVGLRNSQFSNSNGRVGGMELLNQKAMTSYQVDNSKN